MRIIALHRMWIRLRSRGRIRIGPRAKIERHVLLDLGEGGSISIGRKARISRGAIINPHGGAISIGDNFSLNPYSILYGHGGLRIGNDVRIAAHSVIIPANHIFSDANQPIRKQGLSRVGVMIEDDVWIGANVTVLDGAHIAKGCVIAAGAVVRGRTEPLGIYAGVPARRVGTRGASCPSSE